MEPFLLLMMAGSIRSTLSKSELEQGVVIRDTRKTAKFDVWPIVPETFF